MPSVGLVGCAFVVVLFIVICLRRRNKFSIRRKVCLVTGGSNGIGLGLCQRFLQEGCQVVNLDIVESLQLRSNDRYCYIQCDVSDYDQVAAALDTIRQKCKHIDILVNNAGIYSGDLLLNLTKDEILNVLGTNLHALFWVTQLTMPLMLENPERGYIVNISSCLGLGGVAKMTDYCASKFAAYGFSESLRQEIRAFYDARINVLTVCPYLVNTGMFNRIKIKYARVMPGMETLILVDQIIGAMQKGKAELWTPWFIYIVAVIRLLPTCAYDLIQSFLGANHSLSPKLD